MLKNQLDENANQSSLELLLQIVSDAMQHLMATIAGS